MSDLKRTKDGADGRAHMQRRHARMRTAADTERRTLSMGHANREGGSSRACRTAQPASHAGDRRRAQTLPWIRPAPICPYSPRARTMPAPARNVPLNALSASSVIDPRGLPPRFPRPSRGTPHRGERLRRVFPPTSSQFSRGVQNRPLTLAPVALGRTTKRQAPPKSQEVAKHITSPVPDRGPKAIDYLR